MSFVVYRAIATISRHGIALLFALTLVSAPAYAFDFSDVAQRAKALSAKPYKKPEIVLPPVLKNLSQAQYREIRFKSDKAYWKNSKLPFEIEFFHQGNVYATPVKLNEISGPSVSPIRFNPAAFDYGSTVVDKRLLRNLGFAGFRIRAADSAAKNDVLFFLGASYFRARGKGQSYGMFARGLAIDTALNDGEKFPQFVEFWFARPAATDKELIIYALLDSPQATGAYRFVLKPGTDTVLSVKAQLYLRENINKPGLAPLTSMFYYGENQNRPADDYRPEVHDSDGLAIQSSSGEWIWRPLVNPKRLLVTAFSLNDPQGFGLVQRDRQFSNYEDLSARYDARPSVWVEPQGKWGEGQIELVQIPVPNEANDNIVAFWVPKVRPVPGKPFDLEYRISWGKDVGKPGTSVWVTQTRWGHGYREKADNTVSLLVDFDGPGLKQFDAKNKPDSVVTSDDNGKISSINLYPNEATGGWRMEIQLHRLTDKPVELRGFLRKGNTTLSETWSYILPVN
jgi:glucans biosynthesis protein